MTVHSNGNARLPTAVQYDLPLTVFVLNNKQLAFIKYEQQAAGN